MHLSLSLRSALLISVVACAPATTSSYQGSGFELGPGRMECTEGTLCTPAAIGELPFRASLDLAESPAAIIERIGCDRRFVWDGPEYVYQVDFLEPGKANIGVRGPDGAEVHGFLMDRNHDDACAGWGTDFEADVHPGSYLLVLDSKRIEGPVPTELALTFEPNNDFQDDSFEPNDTRDDAALLTIDSDSTEQINASLTPESPVDWYRIEIDDRGPSFFDETLTLNTYIETSNPNLELTLYSEGGDIDSVYFTFEDEPRVTGFGRRTYLLEVSLPTGEFPADLSYSLSLESYYEGF